jgi:hypothetical protein
MSLDYDYEMLLEDSEHLERCAAQGLSIHSPGVAVVARRWGVMPSVVAQESIGSTIEDGVRAGAHMTAEASKKLLVRFKDWSVEYGKEYAQKLSELTSKGAFLERRALKIKQRYDLTKNLPEHNEVEAGGWTSKVCVDDKVDVHACVDLSDRIGPLTQMTKKYTVLVRSVARGQRVKDDTLRPLGRSTNRAVKRAAGLFGIANPFGKVEAYSLPGNVVVVEHGAKVDFAVARDGDYGHTVPRLSHEQIGECLTAAFTLATEIKKRGVARQGFSYGAINDEIAQLFKDIEELEGQELKDATLRLRNAIRIENAICTSFVRTCEGLLEYCALSLK